MKAVAVIPERRELALVDVGEPKIGLPTEVKLRMLEVGICGTDREICAFQYGLPPAAERELVIGHESLGEVVELGADVTDLALGDLVVPTVRRPCPHPGCAACRAGRQDFCYTGDFTERGIKQRHGYMTELVVDDQAFMNRVPPEIRDVAVLVEPLTIAEKALAQVWQVQQRLPWVKPGERQSGLGHSALVLGAGAVGLLGALALAAAGFGVTVYSREPSDGPKAKLVRRFAKYASAGEQTLEQVAGGIGNVDLVYEAVGASAVAFEMMKFLGVNGVFVFTGVPGKHGPISVDADLIMRNLVLKNQVVFGTVNAGRDAFAAAIRDLVTFRDRWPEVVGSLIAGRFPLDGYRELLLGDPPGVKNVLRLAGT
ncbi:MAG: alcohol dehydrogenase catalytic domain-containing protein [Candidatus Binatia bacterium]